MRVAQLPVQSADRALQILLAFERQGQELTVGCLARRLGVHASTASRLAATLESRGFLRRARAGEAFRLGPQAARLGMLALSGESLSELARGPMTELAAETGECVVLSVAGAREAIDVAEVNARYAVGTTTWVGRRTPLHATADGKALLAFGAARLDPAEPLAALTARTHTDHAALARELVQIRERGFGIAVGELEDGLNGVAAPVLAADGRCLAALSVSGPAYRVPPDRLLELAGACVAAADGIGAQVVEAPGVPA